MTLKSYPLTYSPIRAYWEEISSGRLIVSAKIYRLYKHLNDKLEDPTQVLGEEEYFYSPERANYAIEFIENFCRHSKGKFGGRLVELELWEQAMIAAIFGFVDIEGNRQYRQAILIVAKKNGKSLLASAIGLYMLIADGESGPEVYAAATKRDQAKIIWMEAKRMVRKSPALAKRIRSLVSELACDFCDGTFKPLSSDSDTLDGLNPNCVLMDEIHQWKNGRLLYDILADGITAREQPLIFITSTAGTIREDIYDQLYEECEKILNGYLDPDGYHDLRTLPIIYELDSRAEWIDPKCWIKANPGLGTIKNAQTLKERVEKAKANPALVRNLICKDFNIRETSSESWLNFEDLDNRETFELDLPNKTMTVRSPQPDGSVTETVYPHPTYGIGGADLSSTTDLTAAKVLFKVPGCDKFFTLSMYWLPEDLLERRCKEDKIPYDKWAERGLLRLCPGNAVHQRDVKAWFVEVQEEYDVFICYAGYDAWSAKYWVEDMEDYFGKSSMIPVKQGKQTLSDPMKRLGNDLTSKLIVYNNNPIDKWCLANTAYEEDRNGNIQPHKTHKATRRIDGTAALLDAYVVYLDHAEEYQSMIMRRTA